MEGSSAIGFGSSTANPITVDRPKGTRTHVPGPIALVQPGAFYQYADPALEGLSAGQKLLLRMGTENAAVIKKKLTELRKELLR